MQAKLLAAVVATCCAVPALAQSSVTMYGIADAGLMKATGETVHVVSAMPTVPGSASRAPTIWAAA